MHRFHLENRLTEPDAGRGQFGVPEGLAGENERPGCVQIGVCCRGRIDHRTVAPLPAQGLIRTNQMAPGPRPDGGEGRPVVECHGHEHRVRLAFAHGVAILVAADDPTVRLDVGGEKGTPGFLAGGGGKSRGGVRRRRRIRRRGGAGNDVQHDHQGQRNHHHNGEQPDHERPGRFWRLHPATLRVYTEQIRLLGRNGITLRVTYGGFSEAKEITPDAVSIFANIIIGLCSAIPPRSHDAR
jgi:hypothetical protein